MYTRRPRARVGRGADSVPTFEEETERVYRVHRCRLRSTTTPGPEPS